MKKIVNCKYNIQNVLISVICLFFLFFLITFPTYGDSNSKGSIEIQLEETAEKVSRNNVEFQLIKCGEVINGEFQLIDSYQSLNIDLNNLKTADELLKVAIQLDEFSKNNKEVGVSKVTNSSGYLQFNNLDIGIYLITVNNQNNYDTVSPFIVSIPTFNEISGNMDYNIKAIPKHEKVIIENVPTGDNTKTENYMYLFIGSASILVLGMFTYIIKKNKKQD